jgi:hypothetical protein
MKLKNWRILILVLIFFILICTITIIQIDQVIYLTPDYMIYMRVMIIDEMHVKKMGNENHVVKY